MGEKATENVMYCILPGDSFFPSSVQFLGANKTSPHLLIFPNSDSQ